MESMQRKVTRLPGYDYSRAGGYFVTFCTYQRKCTLSRITPETQWSRAGVELTELGETVREVMLELSDRHGVVLREYVIMPNHIHMILEIKEQENAETIGRFVGACKSLTANRWRRKCDARALKMGPLWQRNYYDHILRGEKDYKEKYEYIENNPDQWILDELYPAK